MVLAATGVAGLISFVLLLFIIAIVGVIILSWFPQQPDTPMYSVFTFLRRVTDPVLEPLRRLIPPVGGVIDLSPMIVIFVLSIIRSSL